MASSQAEYKNSSIVPHIRFMVTSNCNLCCKECQPGGESYTRSCYFSKNDKVLMSPEEIQKLAMIASKVGFSPIKITGGEPLTRPDISEIVSLCKKIPKAIVNLGTNGLFLERMADDLYKAKLDSLNIGINSLDRKTYEADTGIDGLSSVLNGLEKVSNLKIPTSINMVLMKQNFQEIDKFIKISQKYMFNLRVLPLSNLGDYTYWVRHFVSPTELENYLIEKYGVKSHTISPWSGLGTPMSTFLIDGVEIRIINPENGVFYSKFCHSNKCGNFPCTDGIWALRIDSDGTSKYCFYPKSGKRSFNYLKELRAGNLHLIERVMAKDFSIISSAKPYKLWNKLVEESKIDNRS